MNSGEVKLVPIVANVAASLVIDDGAFRIPDDAMARFCEQMVKPRSQDARTELATHLVAYILKLEATAKDKTRLAVAQVVLLVTLLLDSWADAQRALAGAGATVDVKKALGAVEPSSIPLSARERVAGALSPLGARLASTSSKSPKSSKKRQK